MTKSLARLLPSRYRDKTIDALIGNLFDQHLSKPDTETFYGFVGSTTEATSTDIYIDESDIERQANQLEPALYVKAATDEDVTTWADLVQRMNLLGISYSRLNEWFTVGTHNFAPPIDLDKFVNYSEYVWIGGWLIENDTLPYDELGIPNAGLVAGSMLNYNANYAQDYYVQTRGLLLGDQPIESWAGGGWTDWQMGNLWVHKDDALAFYNAHGATLTYSRATAAKRPIIELFGDVQLNAFTNAGTPSDSGTPRPAAKSRVNQPPQLDLYYHNGEHAGLTSAGFFYAESPAADVDEVLGRRVQRTGENFMFGHGFLHPTNGRLLWYRRIDSAAVPHLQNMWVANTEAEATSLAEKTVDYMKYSTVGTVLNLDKLTNFHDYYWNDPSPVEYTVIQQGGTSDWSLQNYWTHVADLTYDQRLAAVPATRPIIEFNAQLEADLIYPFKSGPHVLPRFNLYHQRADGSMETPPDLEDATLDDYTKGFLFARLDDCPPVMKAAILASSELSSRLLLEVNGELYVQSLANGSYKAERDGVTYGYTYRELSRNSVGNGQVLAGPISTSSVPRLYRLTATDPTSFNITDSIGTSFYGQFIVDSPLNLFGAELTIIEGSTPFVAGDEIVIEIKSVVYERSPLYVRLGQEFKTFNTAANWLTDSIIRKLVTADIDFRDGAWITHPALSQNLDSENGSIFNQADLITHFASIIESQPGIEGNAFGRNSWRDLGLHQFSLGGTIKQIDERLALFLSTLLQPGATPVTLLEASKQAYDHMLSRIREYVELYIIDDMVNGDATIAGGSASVDDKTVARLIKFLEGEAHEGDLGAARPFFDTTMPIKALTLTGPYIGVGDVYEPTQLLDAEQNIFSILHHDGHMSPYPAVDDDVIKRLVMKLFKRSTGQVTAGTVTGPQAPSDPFAKQLWLDLSQMKLWVFDVVGDQGEMPMDAAIGSYTYNRETKDIYQFNGTWNLIGNDQATADAVWRPLDLGKTIGDLILAIETKLYQHCPYSLIVDPSTNAGTAAYDQLMKKEFESWASKHGIVDPYTADYNATNPFTWNYTGSSTANADAGAWQQIYQNEYGTPRPDLYPWIACGMTEAAFIANLISVNALPIGTTAWDVSMWTIPGIAAPIKTILTGAGMPLSAPGQLSVNLTTGNILPPFAFGNAEQLFTDQPSAPADRFTFGQLGPIELVWSRTTDYRLATYRTAYRLDPLRFTQDLWGGNQTVVSGYRLNERTGLKSPIADVLLHGSKVSEDNHNPFIANASVPSLPTAAFTVRVTVRSSETVEVEDEAGNIQLFGVGVGSSTRASGLPEGLEFDIIRPLEGLCLGAVAVLTVDDLGGVAVDYIYPSYEVSAGLGQVLVHSLRREAIDATLIQALSRLTAWEPRLAYRFNALIDTNSLEVRVGDEAITESNLTVLLDEVRHRSSQWYSALKLTIFRRGAEERAGNIMIPALNSATGRRGDDWAFRIDVLNTQGPGIEYYVLDPTSDAETFMALGGRRSVDEWLRPTKVLGPSPGAWGLQRSKGPFLVTGIQNLANFLFGYAMRQEELGFRAGGLEEAVLDEEIGRKIDWQLLVEMSIDKMFTGAQEGAWSILNPFKNELAFQTNAGVVTSFADPVSDESLVPMLLDENGKRLPHGTYRVFRQGATTTANFDVPVYGMHVMTSMYEHVVLLPYSDGSKLIFSPLLGQRATRMFVTGERQRTKNGRLEFGGKFLHGHEMRENIEGSVTALKNLFDAQSLTADTDRSERVRAMLGFHEQDYFRNRGTSAASEFRFYQGLLRSKGTNSAVGAYLNSRSFNSAYLDEYWAYKVATYGDGRPVIDVDLKVLMEDYTGDYANYLFLEPDELDHLDDWAEQMGYDVPNYDVTPFDGFSIYGADQLQFVDAFDPRGTIMIRPDNPDRWYRYDDVGQLRYLEADKFIDVRVTVQGPGIPHRVRDRHGNLVRADRFDIIVSLDVGYDLGGFDSEVFDKAFDQNSPFIAGNIVGFFYENGTYIEGTNPPVYTEARFRRLNHSTIVFDDATLAGRTVIVRCYGPGLGKFTPTKLYRYNPEVLPVSDDIIWWDPARGFHHPEAFAHVDYVLRNDPATYNESLLRGEGTMVNSRKPWGDAQVGKVWWNMSQTSWLPYSDTRIYPNLQARLAAWGGIAEFSDLKLHEWVQASVPPAQYRTLVEAGQATGEPGMGRHLYRDRAWQQRPVAWLYSANPKQKDRQALAYQTVRLAQAVIDDQPYLISWQGVMPEVMQNGVKVAAATYSSPIRNAAQLSQIHGQLLITQDTRTFIVGSTTSATAPSMVSTGTFTNPQVVLLQATLVSVDAARGPLKFDSETVGTTRYARATFTDSGLTQRIVIPDTPAKAGALYELVFDNLGVKLTGYVSVAHTGTPDTRKASVQTGLAITSHNVVVREALPVQVQIPVVGDLAGRDDLGVEGWLAWKDPTALGSDNQAPLHKWEAFVGEWVDVADRLATLTTDIKERARSPWTLRDGNVIEAYRSVWSRWRLFKDKTAETMYHTVGHTHDQALRAVGFHNLEENEIDRAVAYVNGKRVPSAPKVDGTLSYLDVATQELTTGDSLRVVIPAYVPTGEQLSADLSLASADPSAMREYKLDIPYVMEEVRNDQGRVVETKYFYWVTGREEQAINKRMGTALAERLLRNHDGGYAVPQIMKSYNQVDGRPNRYAMLCVRGISHLVKADNTFRLKIKRDPGMRESSKENSLKVRHSEWTLIRPGQVTRLPKELWDKLVDTLAGETALGVSLPYVQLYEHDLQSDVKSSYGLGEGQVLTDKAEAKATVLGIMASPQTVRYDEELQAYVPDPISYAGFDLSTVEARMSTAAGTRELMAELWLNAKPKQLNELFFAVLEDCLARTTELADIFKTSYIGLGEVRTASGDPLGQGDTIIRAPLYNPI